MSNEFLEQFYASVVIPNYTEINTKRVDWSDHKQAGPDTWIHYFRDGNNADYGLVFNDYYTNRSFLDDDLSYIRIKHGEDDFIRFGSEPPYRHIENITGYFSLYKKNNTPIDRNKNMGEHVERRGEPAVAVGASQITTVDMSGEILHLADHLREKKDSLGEELLTSLIAALYREGIDDVAFSSLDMLRYIEMSCDEINGDESRKATLAVLKDDLTNPDIYFKHAIRDIEKDLHEGIDKHVLTRRYQKYDDRSFSKSHALIWEKLTLPFDDIGCDLDCSACNDTFIYEAENALRSLDLYRTKPTAPTIPSMIATYRRRVDDGKMTEGASVTVRFRDGRVEVVDGSVLATLLREYMDTKHVTNIADFIPACLPDALGDWMLSRGSIATHMFFEYELI